jgi:5-methylcytosine-specific restriction endonuclease McrA
MMRTLIISSGWEPMYFADEKKTANLLCRGVVDVISVWENEAFIPQLQPLLPAILRLKDYVQRRHRMPKFRRRVVFMRDDWECQYCGTKVIGKEATIDHVHPQSLGGKNEWKNCVTACKPCNRWKGNKKLEKSGMNLLREPQVPNVSHFWDLRVGSLLWHKEWDTLIKR